MKYIKLLAITLGICCISGELLAQKMLSKDEAVHLALKNNLGIRLAKNTSDLAKNNTSKYNTGELPFISLNGGYNYRLDNTSANFQDGRTSNLSFAGSQSASASLNANYTLYDGYMRKYNIQQLQERYALSELEVEATMENIVAQTLSQYYQIVSLVENLAIIDEAINISRRRLERAIQQFEYGQGARLAILNAQVDLNNDSLSYHNANLQLHNAKRLLNNLMVDHETMDYNVDSNAEFITGWSRNLLKENMLIENLGISQINKNISIGNISIDLAQARKLPTIESNISYGYSYNKNNSASFLSSLNTNGLNAGLTLTWNIFDGGATRHTLEQAKLINTGLALDRERIVENLLLDFDNTWATYENRLFIYETQVKNVAVNRANFERTEEQFKIGQINSIEYRQAQLNLLNAETVLNTAKFQVKISEVQLLLLSGQILD